jgi:hypothetical protein
MFIRPALSPIASPRQRAHISAMTERATERPKSFEKPGYWDTSPAPKPADAAPEPDPDGLSPTRYGDWVLKGIAVDF